jgi:MFS family permease
MTREEKKVIFASSLGTVFEWYDFYLYGSLAAFIGAQFFAQYDEATRNIFALLAFAAGFLVRPFGALVFGRVGDMVGRKYTFLVTILIMGLSTFIVGILPGSAQIGFLAPVILISLRLLQGLALGGEYGGAATYVAEHAPQGRRGFYTSWIQTTATLGLFMSLIVILVTRTIVGEKAFAEFYWRVPFLLSVVLLGISVWIRMQLNESPAFQKMKEEGTHSKAPLSEAFGQWRNAKVALIALLGLTAGQGVVWYTGQFYALFFLQSILKVDLFTSNLLIAWSLAIGTAGFVFFGWLSDKIGRKPIIMAGCLIAIIVYFPVFTRITEIANPTLAKAVETIKVSVVSDKADCGDLFNPVGTRKFTSSCDLARDFLAKSSVKYTTEIQAGVTPAKVKINDTEVPFDVTKTADSQKAVTAGLQTAGYPKVGDAAIVKMASVFDLFRPQVALLVGYLTVLVILVTMVYGPIAAALVELFPTRIRYTSMSLPYHIGNGWFGGLLPATAFAIVAATGDIYAGLWYPIIFAGMTFIIGLLFVPETKDRDIFTYQGN